jgi:hypothetical protein
MNVGTLAWRTPTGAMLWEILARNKASYLWHGVALAAGLCFVQWKRQGVSEIPAAVLALLALAGFIGGYLQLLSCFAHVEVDSAKVKAGYPGHLLLKPLRNFHLVMVPMLVGGLVTTTVLDIWVAFVLKPLGLFPVYSLSWISIVALSFFWWMQALAWGLPLVWLRSFVTVAMALLHLIVGVIPQLTFIFNISPGWQWGIAATLLVSAVPSAWVGLKLMREGRWDGSSWISILWSRLLRTRTRDRRARFRSAFGAQFWLEWQRQGWLLPGFSGTMALVVFPFVFFVGFKWSGVDAPPPEAILALMLFGPLLLSGVMGPAMAKFDLLGSTRELPVYISVRPMTNGGFVMAKLAMALASSALTLLISVAGICLCLAIAGKWTVFSKAGLITPLGPISYLTGCLPVLLLLVIMVWKNLMAGIGTGLTGRPWIANLGIAWRGAAYTGLMALVMAANLYEDFRGMLLHWLTAILIACLAAKIAVSIAAFIWGLRRNAITARAVGWMVGGWLVCGLFVAGYADHVCGAINQPGLRIWVTLGGFLVLPLADLAIAPLALAWNRHR